MRPTVHCHDGPPLQPFTGFNEVLDNETERMVQFHIYAANTQLRQAYYGFIAALGLDRTLIMPKVRFWMETCIPTGS